MIGTICAIILKQGFSAKKNPYTSKFIFLFFKDEHLSLNLLQLFLDFLRHRFLETSSYFQAQFLLKYHKKVLKSQAGYPDIFTRDEG